MQLKAGRESMISLANWQIYVIPRNPALLLFSLSQATQLKDKETNDGLRKCSCTGTGIWKPISTSWSRSLFPLPQVQPLRLACKMTNISVSSHFGFIFLIMLSSTAINICFWSLIPRFHRSIFSYWWILRWSNCCKRKIVSGTRKFSKPQVA